MVPFALGMRPLAFKEDRMVKPMDLPALYIFRYFVFLAVAL